MHSLLQGNQTFQRDVMPGLLERFASLAETQRPHTLMVICSDSRVDPSLITQTLPGELFIVRNAGNLVPLFGEDGGSGAAIEYAVRALGVQRIVVCGHSGCGAMERLLAPASIEALPTVAEWVEHAACTREAVPEGTQDGVAFAVQHNVRAQLQNLLSHPSVEQAYGEGALTLEAWVYDMPTGRIDLVEARTRK